MRVICNGSCSKESAAIQIKSMNTVIGEQGGHIDRLLADMTATKLFSIDAQILFSAFLKSRRVTNFAFFGASRLIAAIIRLMSELSDTDNQMQFFATEKEALSWLKSFK
jgi:hypothetical protein